MSRPSARRRWGPGALWLLLAVCGQALLSLAVGAASGVAFAQSASGTGRAILVSVQPGTDPALARARLAAAGVAVVEQIAPLPVYRVEAPAGGGLAEVQQALQGEPLVRTVEADGEQVLRTVPNDPRYRAFQWNLQRIGMEQAWDLRPSAPTVVVAVLDTGVDFEHPDLRGNLLLDRGYDFVGGSANPQDDESHGTGVAGVIGAIGNNREGLSGIAWRVRILPIKVLNAEGRGSNSTLAKAIIYAVDNGAQILNVSSTSADYSFTLEQAIAYAREKGAFIVAAAGNTGDQGNEVTYPAAFEGVFAVGATDENDRLAGFSQRGPYVALVAPGVDIPSTAWIGAGQTRYASYSGTSIAAPHVSGVAALLWTLRPDLSADELAETLRSTADATPGSNGGAEGFGSGILNAARAVASVRTGVPPRTPVQAAPPLAPVPPPAPLPAEPRRWLFAEGNTRPPFTTSFALDNPNDRPATVRFTFLSPQGTRVQHEMQVPPEARRTLNVEEVLPNAEFSTIVESDLPVFAERSMYFGHDGHVAAGARAAGRTWYLAEGSTAPGFDTWVLIMNPNPGPTTATLRFTQEDGSTAERVETIPGFGRRSVYVNLLFTAAGFATRVEASQPIVVERAMYFDGGQGGHDTVGTQTPGTTWYLAAGASRPGFDTWLLVQNPSSAPASVQASFVRDDGRVVTQPLFVRPGGRASLLTNLVVPDASFGIRVEADQPVVVERAVYFAGGRAGFNSTAVAAPAVEWYLPEGATTESFVEQLSVLNPQNQPATLLLEFRRQDGTPVAPQQVLVGANTSRILDINPLVLDGLAATRVTADRPVVVERTLYFARPGGLGATSSPGLTR